MPHYRIEIDGIGEAIDCPAGQTLLHAALRQGLGFPYECSSGSCGTCQFQLLAGEMENLWPDAPGMSDRARRKGDRWLACQSIACSDALIRVTSDERCKPLVTPDAELVALADVLPVARDMRQFNFKGGRPANFVPGQYILLDVPTVAGARAYSMCNLPNGDGEWQLIIKRKAGGALTRHLFEDARPGTMFRLRGPYGLAVLEEAMNDIVCIAGGSGLSPMLSIVHGLLARTDRQSRTVQLFYGGRSEHDIIELPSLVEGGKASGSFEYVPAISEPAGSRWAGERGFVHEVAARRMTLGRGTHIFVAGPPPMIQATLAMLEARGVARSHIHFDSFY